MTHSRKLLAALMLIASSPAACSKRSEGAPSDAGRSAPPPPSSRNSAFTCASATPVVVDRQPTGYARCARDGTLLRAERIASCPMRGADAGARCEDSPCRVRADCPGKNAYCGRNVVRDPLMGLGSPECVCRVGCATDSDCAADEACFCEPLSAGTPVDGPAPVGRCVRAACRGDADCSGRPCYATTFARPGLRPVMGFACASDADTCATDSDCSSLDACMFVDGHRACAARFVDGSGRPFVVDARTRVARLSRTRAWC